MYYVFVDIILIYVREKNELLINIEYIIERYISY